mmetsp:Transcript_18555/g.40379  ORF Transcript_18555/g.40379 Transcript_18555/m.40379 type:complete len:900 (+) Transcript_18555:159-2858(+)
MRLQIAHLILLVLAKQSSSFLPPPSLHVCIQPSRTSSRSCTPTDNSIASLQRLYMQGNGFVEDDFYFEDEEDDERYDDRLPLPRSQRQRKQPQRARRQPQRQRSSPPPTVRDEFDSFSMVEEEIGRMSLDDDEDDDNEGEVVAAAAPIIRSRREVSDGERYYNDDDGWDDDEFNEEDDYYEEDFDDDDDSGSGNFWSNPNRGLDPYPSRGSSRASRMPPSTAEPQPDTKTRGSRRRRDRSADDGDPYGRPPPSRRRPSTVQKTTFRSGTPPPPPLMKNFYDRFFWFGFDPRETTSPTDRTMFGGTKGKFSGLDVIRETDGKPAKRRGPHGERVSERDSSSSRSSRRPSRNDDEWDDEWNDDDDSDMFGEDESSDAIIPRPLLPGLSIEEKRSSRPPPPRSRRRQEPRDTRRSPSRSRNWSEDEYDDGNDGYGELDIFSVMGRKRREQNIQGRFRSNSEWAANEVSSWFEDDDISDDGRYDQVNGSDDNEYWLDSSYEQPMTRSMRRSDSRNRRRGTRQRDGRSRRRRDNTPPLLGLVDNVFGFNPTDISEKAKEYEEKIGRAKPSRRGRGARNEVSRRRRAGYAYRYEEDDESPPVADLSPSGRRFEGSQGDIVDATIENTPSSRMNTDRGVIDISAEDADARRSVTGTRTRQTKKRQRNSRSWEDRESEEMDRIPPSGVMAYGPQGDIGMDARTFAALQASEEIREAKRKVEVREERVIDAEEEVLTMKAEVEAQKRVLSNSRRGKSQRARDTLRQMNMMVEEAARSLRRARAERDLAIDAMEELEDRHSLLLSLVRGDEEFARLNAMAADQNEGDEQEDITEVAGNNDNEEEEEEGEWLQEKKSLEIDDIDVSAESLDNTVVSQTIEEVGREVDGNGVAEPVTKTSENETGQANKEK